MKFKLFDTDIKIDYLLLLFISCFLLIERYEVLFVFLFCLLHELGHLLCLACFKQKVNLIVISYYGIGIKFDNKLSSFKEITYLCCGVLVNLLFVLIDFYRDINFALLIINLMPIYPFDGGRILKALLNELFKVDLAYKLFKYISLISLCIMFIYSVYCKNISLIIISIYSMLCLFNSSYE